MEGYIHLSILLFLFDSVGTQRAASPLLMRSISLLTQRPYPLLIFQPGNLWDFKIPSLFCISLAFGADSNLGAEGIPRPPDCTFAYWLIFQHFVLWKYFVMSTRVCYLLAVSPKEK